MQFPLDLRFKLIAIASQIAVRDNRDQLVLYVKQKAFKLKEAVTVFADEAQTRPLYRINADRVLDISAQYRIEDTAGQCIGVIQRRGMRSFWRARYDVHCDGKPLLSIEEANPWVKVADSFLTQIPVLGMFAGYLFHPAYHVSRSDSGAVALRVEKRPAFLEGRYRIDARGALTEDEQRLAVLGILMMLLLERQRG